MNRLPLAGLPALAAVMAIVTGGFLCAAVRPALGATVSGTVTDSDGEAPIIGANVGFFAADTLAGGAVSRTDGSWRVTGLARGTYRVQVRAFGFRSVRDTLRVGSQDLTIDYRLAPEPFAIPAVEVEAASGRAEEDLQPSTIQMDAETLTSLPGIGEKDLFRGLQLLPGIQAASDISSGLYIRGGGPDQTLILLDETPIYNPTHAFGFFSTFNPDVLRDVTLYKGAYPAEYGGRLGSVVDVTGRDGDRSEFHGTGGVSLIAARLTLDGPMGDGTWLLGARRTYLEPILSAIRNDENEIPEYYFYDVNARLTQTVSPRDNLILSAYHGNDDLYLDLDVGTFVDLQWGNTAVTGQWTRTYGDRAFTNVVASYSRYQSQNRINIFSTPIQFDNHVNDATLKGVLNVDAGKGHRLRLGAEGSAFDFGYSQDFNNDPGPSLNSAPPSAAGFIQDDWSPAAGTDIRSGLRLVWFGETNRWSLEPRLSITRSVSPTVRLKVGGGGYNQSLQLVSTEGFSGADYWVPTDETAAAGRSWQGVLGTEWQPSEEWFLSAESYYTDLSGLVQLDNTMAADSPGTTTEDLFRTDGAGYATGLELFVERRMGPLTGWVGYTLGYSRRQFDELNQGNEFPPKYDRRHDLKFVVDWKKNKWGLGASLLYGTGQAFTPAGARYRLDDPGTGEPTPGDFILPAPRNSARLKPFSRLDVSVTRKGSLFGAPVEWYLQVFNLMNRKNEWFITYDTTEPETLPEVTYQLPIIPTVGVNFAF